MRVTGSPLMALAAATLVCVSGATAQSIVSAKSGALHHVEGTVLIDDKLVKTKFGEFPSLAESSVLKTELGRAEMLLTPGIVVRVAENSAVRMLSSQLSDTRLELVDGSVLVEVMEILEGNSVTLLYKDSAVRLLDEGLYRIDSEPGQLRVHEGKAQVASNDKTLVAKKGRTVTLDGELVASKFDAEAGDSLYRWSSRRSGYLAMANVSAAKSLLDWGVPWRAGGWYFNPYFGMYTFIPASGMFSSPFGWSYWSPARVYYAVYAPPVMSGGGGGGNNFPSYTYSPGFGSASVGSRSIGVVSAPSGGAPSAAPAPSPRGGDSGSPRGDAGGGGR